MLSSLNPNQEDIIISVEKSYPSLAQRCHEMEIGQSVYLPHPEIPYDLHRYRDGWHAFWKSPPNGQIGRLLVTRGDLAQFLDGKWTVGRPIRNLLGVRKYLNGGEV